MGIETQENEVESLGNTTTSKGLSPNLRDVAFKELGETDEVRPLQGVHIKLEQLFLK